MQQAQTSVMEQEIRESEERLIQARLNANVADLDHLLADELAYGHSGGSVDAKESYLAAFGSGGLKYRSLQLDNVEVRVYGEAAVVTARMRIQALNRGQDVSATMRIADMWVRRDGRWQLVVLQSTRLPE